MANRRVGRVAHPKLTAHDLALGGVEHHGDRGYAKDFRSTGGASISVQHGTYAVRGFTARGEHRSQNFKTLTRARAFARKIVSGK